MRISRPHPLHCPWWHVPQIANSPCGSRTVDTAVPHQRHGRLYDRGIDSTARSTVDGGITTSSGSHGLPSPDDVSCIAGSQPDDALSNMPISLAAVPNCPWQLPNRLQQSPVSPC